MSYNEYHVVHNPGGGWDVKKANSERASFHADTKEEATAEGRRLARIYKSELFIHGLDGEIQSRDSYGNDPFPPRG